MNPAQEKTKFINAIKTTAVFIILLWVIHLLQISLQFRPGYFGLYPRRIFGLRGILLSPLMHSNFEHLISNTVPMAVLMTMLFYFYNRVATRAFIMIYLLTGITVWLFARPVFHIGASGVVYGLLSFIFWMGVFRRSIKSVILTLIVTVLYSGYTAGILPNQQGISWESHLLGAISGIFTAFWFKGDFEDEEVKLYADTNNDSTEELDYFLDRDTFTKTKAERTRKPDIELPDWSSSRTWKDGN